MKTFEHIMVNNHRLYLRMEKFQLPNRKNILVSQDRANLLQSIHSGP